MEIRAYIRARVALHISAKEIFSELCRIHGSAAVTLRTVFRWVGNTQGVNVVLWTVTVQAGLLLQQQRKPLNPWGVW